MVVFDICLFVDTLAVMLELAFECESALYIVGCVVYDLCFHCIYDYQYVCMFVYYGFFV